MSTYVFSEGFPVSLYLPPVIGQLRTVVRSQGPLLSVVVDDIIDLEYDT